MSAKFGRRLFPHSSVILITDRTTEGRKDGMAERSHVLCLVGGGNKAKNTGKKSDYTTNK